MEHTKHLYSHVRVIRALPLDNSAANDVCSQLRKDQKDPYHGEHSKVHIIVNPDLSHFQAADDPPSSLILAIAATLPGSCKYT